MPRNLDTSMAAALPNALISPAILAAIQFRSGPVFAWSGVGNLVWNGNTYQGVGNLGRISQIEEGTDVEARGMTLELMGISLIDGGGSLGGPTPPVPVPSGQFVAFSSQPTAGSVASATTREGGSQSVTATSGIINVPVGQDEATLQWTGFTPPTLPSDAVVTNIIPTAFIVSVNDGVNIAANGGGGLYITDPGFGTQVNGGSLGTNLAATVNNSSVITVNGGAGFFSNNIVSIDNIVFAVYYTSASLTAQGAQNSIAIEADINQGAPAQVYLGLLSNGAFIGSPYMLYSGFVDQPTIDLDDKEMSITLDLENKLANLVRATQRRYTAADQRLYYPDDTGLNWVEQLNDMALRWGG